jgi:hypothetical protein
MKKIVFTRPDGGVSVVNPAPEFVSQFETEEQALQALEFKAVPADATDVVTVDVAGIPTDREFRDAWTQTGGAFGISIAKARTIQLERAAQAIELAETRIPGEITRARMEGRTGDVGALQAELASIQALNIDVVRNDIVGAADVASLRAAFPSILERHRS